MKIKRTSLRLAHLALLLFRYVWLGLCSVFFVKRRLLQRQVLMLAAAATGTSTAQKFELLACSSFCLFYGLGTCFAILVIVLLFCCCFFVVVVVAVVFAIIYVVCACFTL